MGVKWFAIFLLLLVIIAAIVGAVLVLFRRKSPSTDPICGKCGYQVRGLTTFTCPECGSDLREVGIVSGVRPVGYSLSLKLVLVVIAWLPLAVIVPLLATPMTNSAEAAMVFFLIALLLDVVGLIVAVTSVMRRHNALASIPTARPAAPRTPTSAFPVDSPRRTRNLSIVFVDMHDYTARVARESRDGVIDLIRGTRQLIQPIVESHGGTIVKTIGDAFLITFESPTDAVLTARQLQQAFARHNTTVGDDKCINLRIGISTGEVALEHNDVYGDPVNLANRIQQLAQPGEILFNEATFHAMKRSEVPHEVAGDFELKGVDGQVKLYRAVTAS